MKTRAKEGRELFHPYRTLSLSLSLRGFWFQWKCQWKCPFGNIFHHLNPRHTKDDKKRRCSRGKTREREREGKKKRHEVSARSLLTTGLVLGLHSLCGDRTKHLDLEQNPSKLETATGTNVLWFLTFFFFFLFTCVLCRFTFEGTYHGRRDSEAEDTGGEAYVRRERGGLARSGACFDSHA